MTQTARTVSSGHALYNYQSSSHNEKKRVASEYVKLSEASNLFTSTATFYYNERIRTTLQFTPEYKQYFSLVKGLIEFYRPATLTFTYDREVKSIDIDFATSTKGQAEDLLAYVYERLQNEIAFKAALKEVIRFEEDYKSRKEQVYQAMITRR